MRVTLVSVLAAAAITGALRPGAQPVDLPWASPIVPMESPAGAGAGQPQLSVSARGALLSWVEPSQGKAALRFAVRDRDGWSAPRTVAAGDNWFVNWADVPSVMRLADGTLAAHWLQKSGSNTYAYDVRLSSSSDEGQSWSTAVTPHNDGTKTEHGFASLFQLPGARGGLGLVWLDGRQMKPGHGEGHDAGDMTLRFAAFDRARRMTADTLLDARVCECCPTAAAVTADGPIVAYRNRAEGEIRDIYVTRMVRGAWTDPVPVSKDDWQFPACPVNGPAISARGRDVALAYFQAKDGVPKSFVVFSRDAGATFGTPIRLDAGGGTLGRVDVELLPDGAAAASYIELTGTGAEFRARRVQADGEASAPITIAPLAKDRSSGYPRMALARDELVFAWVQRGPDGASTVRTATARVNIRRPGGKE